MTANARLRTARGRVPSLIVPPLSNAERGRGSHIYGAREEALKKECYRLILDGFTQKQICDALNATKSRVSRWCQAVVKESGSFKDRRRVNAFGATITQRLFARMGTPEKECWEWQGSVKGNNYGSFAFGKLTRNAHRIVYEVFVGEIPESHSIDHICNNPRCVNPHHLHCVRQNENQYLRYLRSADVQD